LQCENDHLFSPSVVMKNVWSFACAFVLLMFFCWFLDHFCTSDYFVPNVMVWWLALYLWGHKFKSQPGVWLFCLKFLVVPPDIFQDVLQNRSQVPPHLLHFIVYIYPAIQCYVTCTIVKASLNKPRKKERKKERHFQRDITTIFIITNNIHMFSQQVIVCSPK